MSVHLLSCAYLRAGCCGSQPAREVQMLLSYTTLFSCSSGDPDAFPRAESIVLYIPFSHFWLLQVGHLPRDLQRAASKLNFPSLWHCPQPPLRLESLEYDRINDDGQQWSTPSEGVSDVVSRNPNTAFTLIMQGAKMSRHDPVIFFFFLL